MSKTITKEEMLRDVINEAIETDAPILIPNANNTWAVLFEHPRQQLKPATIMDGMVVIRPIFKDEE